MRRVGHMREFDHVLFEPFAVRMFRRDLVLDLFVGDDAAFLSIDQKHATRLQAAFLQDAFRRDIQHADFRRHDDQIIFGHVIARRAKTIAIQRCADANAIGEGDRSRAIPRLHQAGMIFVEGLFLVAHALVIRPRLGNHHHHRVRQRATGQDEQFEAVVEHRRIAAVGVDDREEFS